MYLQAFLKVGCPETPERAMLSLKRDQSSLSYICICLNHNHVLWIQSSMHLPPCIRGGGGHQHAQGCGRERAEEAALALLALFGQVRYPPSVVLLAQQSDAPGQQGEGCCCGQGPTHLLEQWHPSVGFACTCPDKIVADFSDPTESRVDVQASSMRKEDTGT